MKCVLAITLILAMFGHSVNAEKNCYTCVFAEGGNLDGAEIPDVCTDANFDANSEFVFKIPCEMQCKILTTDIEGAQSFARACDEDDLCSFDTLPDGIDLTCCDGDLCNGPMGGGGGGNGGGNGAGLASVSPVVILATTVLSALLLLVS